MSVARRQLIVPALILCLVWLRWMLVYDHFGEDLEVYRQGGQRVLTDPDTLYGSLGGHLVFTYTPLAAIMFTPFAAIGFWPAAGVLLLVSLLAMWRLTGIVATALNLPAQWLPWLQSLAMVATVLEPLNDTLSYGQVNLLITWAVLEDLVAGRERRTRGILLGLAIGLKLTPAIFVLVLLFRKDWRGLLNCTATVLAGIGLGFAVMPRAAWQYWTEAAYDPTRVGGVAYISNQSLNGALWRAFGPGGAPVIWAFAVLVVLAVTLVVTKRALDAGLQLPAVLTVAMAGLLVSPISWTHHWIWVWPMLVLLARASMTSPGRARRAALTLAAAWLLVSSTRVVWHTPHSNNQEYQADWWAKLLGDGYCLLALASLCWLAWFVARAAHSAVTGTARAASSS